MKKNIFTMLSLALALGIMLTGCGNSAVKGSPDTTENAAESSPAKAGTVYYSEPNRIILFYQDAQISAEYTPVGYFDYNDEFQKAVQDNPVLEGWGNKIVQISDGE